MQGGLVYRRPRFGCTITSGAFLKFVEIIVRSRPCDRLLLPTGWSVFVNRVQQRSYCLPERFGEVTNINKSLVVRQVLALQDHFAGVDAQTAADDVPLSHRHVGPAREDVSQPADTQAGEGGQFFVGQLPAEDFIPDYPNRRVNIIFNLV